MSAYNKSYLVLHDLKCLVLKQGLESGASVCKYLYLSDAQLLLEF